MMFGRLVLVELRRGTALPLALAVAVVGTLTLFVQPEAIVGRWAGLAAELRSGLLFTTALVAAIAAWQAGRDHRRGAVDLLRTTPRPVWQALAAGWTASWVAAGLGYLVTFLVGATLVAPYASYAGGGWWWVVLGGLPILGAATAFGVLVGRWLPSRAAALLAGPAVLALCAASIYQAGEGLRLGPAVDLGDGSDRLTAATHVLQALWFCGTTLTLLALATLARRTPVRGPAWAATAGALLAAFGAAPLLAAPTIAGREPDPGGRAVVCTDDGPPVCVTAASAFLLADLAARAQPVLMRLDGVPGAPTRAQGFSPWRSGDERRDVLYATALFAERGGRMDVDGPRATDPVEFAVVQLFSAGAFAANHGHPRCAPRQAGTRTSVERLAVAWALGQTPELPAGETIWAQRHARLTAWPMARQKAWIGAVIPTSSSCDPADVAALVAELDAA